MGELDVSIGPMLIGTFLNVFLLGVMCCQCYIYFVASNKDHRWTHMTVAFLLFADVLSAILDMICVYDYTVTKFGNFEAIQVSNWVFDAEPAMTVIISSVVQAFFAWRIKRLTHQTWLSVLIILSATIQFLCGLGTSIGVSIIRNFNEFQRVESVVIIWLVLSVITDISITTSMVFYLRRQRTGFAATDDLVTRLMRLIIQTGMLTSVWALVDLVIFLSFANSLHLIFNFPLGKLYTNSLMSSLNARQAWSESSSHAHTVPGQSSAPSKVMRKSRGNRPVDGIHVSTTVQHDADEYEMDSKAETVDITSHVFPEQKPSSSSSLGMDGGVPSTNLEGIYAV